MALERICQRIDKLESVEILLEAAVVAVANVFRLSHERIPNSQIDQKKIFNLPLSFRRVDRVE